MRTISLPAAFTFIAAFTGISFAQDSPEDFERPDGLMPTAEGYMECFEEGDWDRAANYYHPEALAELKELFLPLFELSSEEDGGEAFIEMFMGEEMTYEEVKALEDRTFFTKITSFILSSVSQLGQFSLQTEKVIGSIEEDESLSHVLVRLSASIDQEPFLEQIEVISLRRIEGTEDKWGVINKGEVKGMATMLRQQLEAMTPEDPELPEEGGDFGMEDEEVDTASEAEDIVSGGEETESDGEDEE